MAEYKKLITEEIYNDIKGELLEESTTGRKRMFITGPFLQAVDRNRNRSCISKTTNRKRSQ